MGFVVITLTAVVAPLIIDIWSCHLKDIEKKATKYIQWKGSHRLESTV